MFDFTAHFNQIDTLLKKCVSAPARIYVSAFHGARYCLTELRKHLSDVYQEASELEAENAKLRAENAKLRDALQKHQTFFDVRRLQEENAALRETVSACEASMKMLRDALIKAALQVVFLRALTRLNSSVIQKLKAQVLAYANSENESIN